jgi:hypothetical protein
MDLILGVMMVVMMVALMAVTMDGMMVVKLVD